MNSLIPLLVPSTRQPIRLVPVDGDHMEPTLRRGDMVAAVPVNTFSGDGLYVIESMGEPVVYRFQADFAGGIRILRDNKAYPGDLLQTPLTRQDFEQTVIGKVVAICKVLDRSLLGSV